MLWEGGSLLFVVCLGGKERLLSVYYGGQVIGRGGLMYRSSIELQHVQRSPCWVLGECGVPVVDSFFA